MFEKESWLYGGSANDYGESAEDCIPTGGSAIESADWEIETADSTVDSTADSPKVGVWVRALNVYVCSIHTQLGPPNTRCPHAS